METKQTLEQAADDCQRAIDAEMEKTHPDVSLIDLWSARRDALRLRAVYARDERDPMPDCLIDSAPLHLV